jgi:hypothetical protein
LQEAPSEPAHPAPSLHRTVSIGEIGFLRYGDVKVLFCGASSDDLDEISKLVIAKDEEGLKQMLLDGRLIAVDGGTKARLVDVSWISVRVRLEQGNAAGQSVWVPMEYLHAE